VDSDAADGAQISKLALQRVLLGRLEHIGFGDIVPFCLVETEVMLQMRGALFVSGRVDVEDEVVPAIAAHAGEQGPASAFRVVCLVIALGLNDEKVVVKSCARAMREHAKGRALGWCLAWSNLGDKASRPMLPLLHRAASEPVLDKAGGQSAAWISVSLCRSRSRWEVLLTSLSSSRFLDLHHW
jgi:hypothetical protein